MKRIIIIGILLFVCFWAKAQDPHFSQYFASPLSINPANTGFFDGDYRIAIDERKQWWTVGNSYVTSSVSADYKFNSQYHDDYNYFSAGLSGIFEHSLDGVLVNNFITLSGSYQLSMDYQAQKTLTFGLSVNYSSKTIDYTKLTFASQFNGTSFDTSIPVDPGANTLKSSYFDLNTGILYAVHQSKANYYAGAAIYHVNEPQDKVFYADGKLPMRTTLHAGGDLQLGPLTKLIFSGYYMGQGGATDATLGSAFAFTLNNNAEQRLKVYVGSWFKFTSAYIPYFGVDYLDYSVGLNYSVPTSTQLNFNPQTFEVSLIYRRRSYKLPYSLYSNF